MNLNLVIIFSVTFHMAYDGALALIHAAKEHVFEDRITFHDASRLRPAQVAFISLEPNSGNAECSVAKTKLSATSNLLCTH